MPTADSCIAIPCPSDRNELRNPPRQHVPTVTNKPKKKLPTMKICCNLKKKYEENPTAQKQECSSPSLQASLRFHIPIFIGIFLARPPVDNNLLKNILRLFSSNQDNICKFDKNSQHERCQQQDKDLEY